MGRVGRSAPGDAGPAESGLRHVAGGSLGEQDIQLFSAHDLLLPRSDRIGDIVWKKPTVAALLAILKNPAYAGAFVYRRSLQHVQVCRAVRTCWCRLCLSTPGECAGPRTLLRVLCCSATDPLTRHTAHAEMHGVRASMSRGGGRKAETSAVPGMTPG